MNPMQPSPAPGAEAPAPEGGAMPDFSDLNAGDATRLFQDPRFLTDVSILAAKHRQPEALQWLKRANEAAHENVFEALQNLELGDGAAAVKAFNKSGKFNDAKDAQKNEDGTWTLTRKNGETSVVDPIALRKTLLSPKDFFANMHADRVAKSTEKYHEGMVDARNDEVASNDAYRRRLTDNASEKNALMAETAQAKAEGAAASAQARAESARDIAAMKDKTAVGLLYKDAYTEAQKAGSANPADDALKAVVTNPSMKIRRDPKSGAVAVIDPHTGEPIHVFENEADYTTFTGRKLPKMPKAAGAASAAPAEPAPKKGGNPGIIGRMLTPTTGLAQVLDAQDPKKPSRRLARPPEEQDDTYFAP